MPRTARMKDIQLGAWYHIHSRIAGHAGEYPLSAATPARRLLEIIKHYSSIYFCEVARGFKARGMYRKRLRFWAEGVVVGSEEFIRSEIGRMRDDGRYRRRKNPIPQLGGVHLSLREQRSHAVNF